MREKGEERGGRGGNQRGLCVGEAPNCLLQHVMTGLLHINLSLLRAISVSMQEANRFISSRVCPQTKHRKNAKGINVKCSEQTNTREFDGGSSEASGKFQISCTVAVET